MRFAIPAARAIKSRSEIRIARPLANARQLRASKSSQSKLLITKSRHDGGAEFPLDGGPHRLLANSASNTGATARVRSETSCCNKSPPSCRQAGQSAARN